MLSSVRRRPDALLARKRTPAPRERPLRPSGAVSVSGPSSGSRSQCIDERLPTAGGEPRTEGPQVGNDSPHAIEIGRPRQSSLVDQPRQSLAERAGGQRGVREPGIGDRTACRLRRRGSRSSPATRSLAISRVRPRHAARRASAAARDPRPLRSPATSWIVPLNDGWGSPVLAATTRSGRDEDRAVPERASLGWGVLCHVA